MRRFYILYISLFISLLQALPALAQDRGDGVFEISENWTLQCSDSVAAMLGRNFIEATVPGCVHQDLLDRQLIPDPYMGANEEEVQWIENHSWTYTTTFSLPQSVQGGDEILLNFEGLDTYAEIYLNNEFVGRTRNMFLKYSFPVMKLLKPTNNILTVKFLSTVKHDIPRVIEDGFIWPADNDHSVYKTSVYARKAPYSFGWDWGIRLVGAGIWKPVTLERVNGIDIENIRVRTEDVSGDYANVSVDIEATAFRPKEATFSVNVKSPNGKKMNYIKTIKAEKGTHVYSFEIGMENPFLWQPNGYGEHYLYDIQVKVEGDGISDRLASRFGIRSAKLIREQTESGESFCFEINGRRIYAKGANLIPGDALLSRMTDRRYKEIIDAAVEQNMNMLRVWGGGIYEDEALYRYADEAGILIWQDFMFGCTAYPSDEDFVENVRQEVEYNVKRLRNHPSIVLWCGNNEVEEAIKYWGWERKYAVSIGAYDYMVSSYDRLFKEVIPQELSRHDNRPYIHTSPLKANWGRPESWSSGDAHNWGLWYGEKPFESFNQDIFRFVSEFGFQSYPEMKTLRSFAAEEDLHADSKVMTTHQKASTGNALIGKYMERYYRMPSTFEDTVYLSLVMQGEGMYRSIMAQRRNRPYCMGSLYWQLNDSWPVVSWSSIDYYGNRKALHYYAAKAFDPVAVDIHVEEGHFDVNLISDLVEDIYNCDIRVSVKDFEGNELFSSVVNSIFKAGAVTPVTTVLAGDIPNFEEVKTRSYIEVAAQDKEGRHIASAHAFLVAPKDLQLNPDPGIRMTCTRNDRDDYTLTFTASSLVKNLFIETEQHGVRYSDNFFDLLPGQPKSVRLLLPGLEPESRISAPMQSISSSAVQHRLLDSLSENAPKIVKNDSLNLKATPAVEEFSPEKLIHLKYINNIK